MRYDWPVVDLSFRLKGNSKCTCSHFIGSEGGCGGGGGGGGGGSEQGSWH